MTFAKILILIVLISVFVFTVIKLIAQIKEYRNKKQAKKNEIEMKENNNKEVE